MRFGQVLVIDFEVIVNFWGGFLRGFNPLGPKSVLDLDLSDL